MIPATPTILIAQCSPKETITYEVPAWVGDELEYYRALLSQYKTLEQQMDAVERMTGQPFERKVKSRVATGSGVRGVSIDRIIIDDPLDIPIDEAPLS